MFTEVFLKTNSFSATFMWVACSFVCLLCFPVSQAQTSVQGDPRADRDFAYTGRISVQVQETSGEPFFSGATLTLLTHNSDARETMQTTSDAKGRAQFTALPIGSYVMEITAAGYRSVQQQILLTGAQKSQDLVISMVPNGIGKVRIGSISASPKAVKETEKALQDLQRNQFERANEHLQRALSLDPNFADASYLMGIVLLREQQPGKARLYLQKSVQLTAANAAAFLALGEAEYREHDYPNATESMEKFLNLQPNSAQATIARKYVEVMQRQTAMAVSSASEPVTGGNSSKAATDSLTGDSALPKLPDLNPVTEMNWAPPDVDSEKLELDDTKDCQLNRVLNGAGQRVQELVANVDRFTATESVQHYTLSPMGLELSHETREFSYVVEISKMEHNDLNVQEYRNGSVATSDFPGHIATVGLPTLALVFHPYFQKRYEFRCEGRGTWSGRSAWVVHFQQRADQKSGMLVYHIGTRFASVQLKGRAWIDAETSQILAMESDMMKPLPELRLLRDHQLIEYGPVSFRKNTMQLWLPKSADWYCSLAGKRFHRRHSFKDFLLFSVDDKQKITNPPVPTQ